MRSFEYYRTVVMTASPFIIYKMYVLSFWEEMIVVD